MTYKACVPIKNVPTTLTDGLFSKELPKLKVHVVKHKGQYQHLSNAWMAAYAMGRNKEFKINKKIPPLEVYHNSPKDTDPQDLMVDVLIPAK